MGWTHCKLPRADVVKRLTSLEERFESDGRNYVNKVIAHKDHGEHRYTGNLWLVIEQTIDNEKPHRFIVVYLMEGNHLSCSYKDLDEAMHPYYYDCPIEFLDLAPVACQKWRELVREFHSALVGK